MTKRFFLILLPLCFLLCSGSCNPTQTEQPNEAAPAEPELLSIFRTAYPDVTFSAAYDTLIGDWLVTVTADDRRAELYWCGGRLLSADKIPEKENYRVLLYDYAEAVPDPEDFSEQDIERIRAFSAPETRSASAGTPPFFYDTIYDCASQTAVEQHITRITFLGKQANVHERIRDPLAAVERDIRALAETDPEARAFVTNLSQTDGYYWRTIRDSGNRSFHSIGIALDILPVGWQQKNIYWAWRRDIDPEKWMLTPLDRRWMPPESIVAAFEKHGFIWGGKWIIWDNMHFEYHPELILYRKSKK
ncbi:M15 family metallopeptidase [Treponema brennaborense]|uniref:Peptidase M15C domain-containing protein n=1 Tax=Treponema brennaborense (strain DSM 12168 / CIP 105900 / DD5/3) TaxID=906968 RepID=F4LNG1_TREBD|nr:M15 family metallopeptidase [Treponema brennaborense]AEE17919.1 hypothetical protein Trebr_2513 [Treponema brennaborense DSM 12168]